jgi:hypothetical protein
MSTAAGELRDNCPLGQIGLEAFSRIGGVILDLVSLISFYRGFLQFPWMFIRLQLGRQLSTRVAVSVRPKREIVVGAAKPLI